MLVEKPTRPSQRHPFQQVADLCIWRRFGVSMIRKHIFRSREVLLPASYLESGAKNLGTHEFRHGGRGENQLAENVRV